MQKVKQVNDDYLYLIDGSPYLYRAYFAIRQPLSTSRGFPTRAILGVTNMFLKLLHERAPETAVVTWDAKGPTFRHELYDRYKANRPEMPKDLVEQVDWIRKIITALGFKQLEVSGFEADDIIATLVKRFKDRPILIVTGDKDLIQLISERVSIWDPMKDEFLDLDTIRNKFGIEPYQYLDVLTLSGDTADNIPGVPGIGIKTALKLIKQFGSIENLLSNLDSLKQKGVREKIRKAIDQIPLWRKLVSLSQDVPLDIKASDLKVRPINLPVLRNYFTELEFNNLLNGLDGNQPLTKDSYRLITDTEELDSLIEDIRKAGTLVIDTETTSEFPMRADLVGISLCVEPPSAFYIPIAHKTKEKQLGLDEVIDRLGPILNDPSIKKVGQNIKYDQIVMRRHGCDILGIEGDTMLASYLLNPSRHHHNLNEISQEILGYTMTSFKRILKENTGKNGNFSDVPIDVARDYSCEDVHVTALVRDVLWQRLKEAELWKLFQEVEVPLVPLLCSMEMAGIKVDSDGLARLSREFDARLADLETKIWREAGVRFNINSHKQLAEVLFEKLKLPQQKKTKKKTGYSTDVEVLKGLSKIHPLPDLLLKYRNLSKLKSTYVDGLQRMINPDTGRIHTSFNQTVTATGRLSSSDPNLQNIPIRTEEGRRIRAMFIADTDKLLVSADYSQIDLRVLAHYAKDPALLHAFNNGEDIHRRTASEVFNVAPELVTPEMRRVAKTVNFGIVYGMSAYGLAKELDVEHKKAKEFIDRYFDRYPGVKAYMKDAVRQAREKGYVTTILGRRRYIPDINSKSRPVREFAERTAINTPIQGSAADIIKLAMLNVYTALKDAGLKAEILLQVHDELVIEVEENDRARLCSLLKEQMEDVISLSVPLTISVGWGKNWAEV